MTLSGKCVVGGLVAAALIAAAIAYWRSGGARGVMNAENAIALAIAIAFVGGMIALSTRSSARQRETENATVEALNAALRAIAVSTGLSYVDGRTYEFPLGGKSVQPATLSGVYRGVALKMSAYPDSDWLYTRILVRAFPASAGPSMREALGRKLRLRVEVPAGAPGGLAGGLPSDLVGRLESAAQDVTLDEEGLEFRVRRERLVPLWKEGGDYSTNRTETDPARLQAVLDDVCELSRLAGVVGMQDRPLSDGEKRVRDLERRIADRKGRRQ